MSTEAQASLQFSDQAAAKVRAMAAAQGTSDMLLRVYIEGGGCSGFQYGFEFDDSVEEDDLVVSNGDVRLVVDPLSIQYLDGGVVDYKDDLQGSRFVVDNPNARSTCGCGASFAV